MPSKKPKKSSSNSDRDQLLTKFDNLHKNIKKDQATIPRQSNSNKIIVVIIIIVIGGAGLFAFTQFTPKIGTSPPPTTTPATSTSVKLSGNYYNDTGATPVFNGNKLTVSYVGGEFCPYCAMERWAIVMALEQYGNFSGLSNIISAEDSVPTYTFYGSSYSSAKIDFEPLEVSNNVAPPNQKPLQQLSGITGTLFAKYSPSGYFPFICIGGTIYQVGAGASFNLNSFSKQSVSYVQNQINTKSGSIYDQIYAESTLITSYINSVLVQNA